MSPSVDDWTERAACRGADRSVFFPGKGAVKEGSKYAPAKAICKACPVIVECLESTMTVERGDADLLRAGVFGGLGPTQRARLDLTARLRSGQRRNKQEAAA